MQLEGTLIQNGRSLALNTLFARGKEAWLKTSTAKPSQLSPQETSTEKVSAVKAPSQVVAVLGAKGGVGVTTLAVDLATALAAKVQTTLVDANLQQPDVAHLFGKEPLHSLVELLARPTQIDKPLFEACRTQAHEPHLGFLSPPLSGEAGVVYNLSQLASCLQTMRSFSPFWVIDTPRHLDKHLVNLTDTADKIILVFEATVSGVATCQRWLKTFRELGYDRDRIICVLNRSGSKFKAVEEQLGECFADQPIVRIPNASQVSWECSTKGLPIFSAYPNHSYSKAIAKLAEQIFRQTP